MRVAASFLASMLVVPLALAGGPLERYDDLLRRYVAGNDVRYDAWRQAAPDLETLAAIVTDLERTDPAGLETRDRFALYANLYNAKTLQIVLNGDPETSIRDLSKAKSGFGIFYKKIVEFDGQKISLNDLENRLRKESADPRVHFVVNCASASCPALSDESYRGERFEEQLERQTLAFMKRNDALLVEERPGGPPLVRLSKIFDWYGKDFGGSAGVRNFVRRYAPDELREDLSHGFRIAYMDYDWSLNRAD